MSEQRRIWRIVGTYTHHGERRYIFDRFGLDLTPEAFERLGESLDKINEAERLAWLEAHL